MTLIYLNNAATSFPKPVAVVEAVSRWLVQPPADRGRGSSTLSDVRLACRYELAALFGVDEPDRVVLLASATEALNLVIGGLLVPGSNVVTTMLEHNSVLRPIAHRQRDFGVTVTSLRPNAAGVVSPPRILEAITKHTRLIVVTHASNVTGSIQPVEGIAAVAAAAGVPLLIDASQSAGAVALEHQSLPGSVYIAFAGHKGLLGLPGTGGLVLASHGDLPQRLVGGTGERSESLFHPSELPLRHEAGTPNMCGIVALLAGVCTVRERGVQVEGAHRHHLIGGLRSGLDTIAGVSVLPLAGDDGRSGVLSFTVEGWSPEEVSYILEESFTITTRSGLHCAPLAHQIYGTVPLGTIRASVGAANTEADMDALIEAVAHVAGRTP